MKAVTTLDELEGSWRRCVIKFNGIRLLLDQKYSHCLGRTNAGHGIGLAFLVRGFSFDVAIHSVEDTHPATSVGLSVFRPDKNGEWYDDAYIGGLPIGSIYIPSETEMIDLKFNSGAI